MTPNLPRLNARTDEDFAKNQRRAFEREREEVKYVEGKITIQDDTKLLTRPPISDDALLAEPDLIKGAELIAYIKCGGNSPNLTDFREGLEEVTKHLIATTAINFSIVAHITGCLNLEDKFPYENVPLQSQTHLAAR